MNRVISSAFAGVVLFFSSLYLVPHVICDMWRWFMVPLGVIQIHHWHAFGLNSLVGMFLLGIHLRMQDSDEDPDTTAFKLAIKSLTILFTVLASWGIAYLAS